MAARDGRAVLSGAVPIDARRTRARLDSDR